MKHLTEEQKLTLDMVRDVATREIAPRALELDEKSLFPEYARDLFAKLGLLNPLLPAAYGGTEMGVLTLALILEELSRVCASTALLLIAQTDGMLPIIHGGSPELKERYLRRFTGESTLLTALAATEPAAGSDLLAMKTRAERKGDKYVINGQKCFITNGSVADVIVVYAYTDPEKGSKGISAFVVEKGTPGLVYGRNESKMGMRGSINSELFFENMEVPAENIIGAEGTGFANLMQTLSTNRVFCAAQAVGIAQGALDIAIRHTQDRVQFGKPIAHLAPVQFMIADMATAVEASRLLTRKAAELLDDGDKKAVLYGSMAKTMASDTAMRVTTDAVQVLGGSGYMKENGVERMMRDAKLTQIYTGTNQITRMVTGRALLFQ
ncbi:acyl-CoA dehydrogenase family protein [Geobacter hydrogenophilus]|uniref:Cyclohex-1-ene-1-carbonyl-CoA dehydrogenase n=1 Tax=Geobacter hydrogenophilus TaxID=40983 RepID=A0A9W6LCH3_9BACT|nr:cyclohex-1-ene-1-carbonyl-CoA dehydrogenase [Geobacter hydrogenophilus]MBT0893506.1 acyl-CoA dehydrogenase family protein [Geobacter hydrogenophilus]GLI37799.1 acyl-CoA dehydrogenase [Geobacter hydrogenophilus]